MTLFAKLLTVGVSDLEDVTTEWVSLTSTRADSKRALAMAILEPCFSKSV